MKLRIKTLSDALVSSNDKPISIYDNDIIYDDIGLPYIPGKRIKGVLKESALEIVEMYELSGKQDFLEVFNLLFGSCGYQQSALAINNLYIEDYEQVKSIILGKRHENNNLFTKENIIDACTTVRYQTKIDDTGVAEEHSLRNSRVLRKELVFEGYIKVENINSETENLLNLAVSNMRRIGAKRNRGFGKIRATIIK